MQNSSVRFGIDLGGTKIEVLAIDISGNELYRQRIDTPQGNYQATLQSIHELLSKAENELNVQGTVGICTPGSASPSNGLLRNCNSTCLNQKPFQRDIESVLKREVRIANDANCFTLSEATDGNARQYNIVFGVIIGTGCGGGIVINKTLIDGPNAITGEWGHTPLPYSDKNHQTLCWCGKSNCIETFLSGTGLENDYFSATTHTKNTKDIVIDALNNDRDAIACLNRYEVNLAKSLANVINILDPHVIVLGGGLSNIKQLYTNIPKLWQEYVFSDTVSTKIVSPKYGDSSGVRGAAWLWNS